MGLVLSVGSRLNFVFGVTYCLESHDVVSISYLSQ